MKIYHANDQRAKDAVLVDRSTPWGNPYRMRDNGSAERKRVCDKFEVYAIKKDRDNPEWLKPLIGKDLKCWCAPKRCHAKTLMMLANAKREDLVRFL